MALDKQGNFSQQPSELPDVPSPSMTPDQIRAKWQTPLDELKTTMNNAFDKLNATTKNASGADNIGATDWDGVTASTVGALLSWLKANKTDLTGNHQGTWQGFNPSQVDQTIRDKVNANSAVIGISIESYKVQIPETDDTGRFQRAIDDLYANGGGTLLLGAKTYKVSSINKNWDSPVTVNIVGLGKRSTVIQKSDTSTTPIFNFSASASTLETYSNIKNMSIVGNTKTHHGIQIDSCARFEIYNVDISSCDHAIHNLGGLVFSLDNVTLRDNNKGLYSRKSTATGTYCNLITTSNTQIVSNAVLGIDFDEGNALIIGEGTDIESNGTSGDLSTGGILIGPNVNQEIGFANIFIDKAWFELNYGRAIQANGGDISINKTNIINSENGNAIYATGCNSLRLEDVQAPSQNDTVTIESSVQRVLIGNCAIYTINNNSDPKNTLIYNTGGNSMPRGGFTSDVYINDGHKLVLTWASGTGTATIENNTNTGDLEITPFSKGRFKKIIMPEAGIGFDVPLTASTVPNGTLFKDTADNKLKYKDDSGVVNLLY